MRTIVVGTSGQLATELHRATRSSDIELVPPTKVELADEAAVAALLDEVQPALVINAAAYTAVDRAESDRERAFAVNAEGPATLARWCHERSARLVHVSTDYVFDGAQNAPYATDAPTRAINTYGESKLAGEEAIRRELKEHVIVRTSWVFSAHGQNFVKTMLRLAQERSELRVVADQFGRPTPAQDLAAAIWRIVATLARQGDLPWGTYHFAGAGSTSWHGFAQAIVDAQTPITGKTPRVTAIATSDFPTPARRPTSSILDTCGFERTFGITPAPWQAGLERVVREVLKTGPSA